MACGGGGVWGGLGVHIVVGGDGGAESVVFWGDGSNTLSVGGDVFVWMVRTSDKDWGRGGGVNGLGGTLVGEDAVVVDGV